MKHPVPFRVTVDQPLSGVAMLVQKGKDQLLYPTAASKSALSFDFEIDVDTDGEMPNFLGKFAQGPKGARFIYVNSGIYAGQHDSCWGRRAKLSLMSITKGQIGEVLKRPGSRIETTMPGVGGDGGPTCASVKGLEWKVIHE